MWDYYLGGSENYEADREAAGLVLGAAPDVPLAALENREFLKHAVRFLVAEAGISLWQSAIHQRFCAMHLLDQNGGGYLLADLDARELVYQKLLAA